jgi:hypothetical protein
MGGVRGRKLVKATEIASWSAKLTSHNQILPFQACATQMKKANSSVSSTCY